MFQRFGKTFDDEISFNRSFTFMPDDALEFPDTYRNQGKEKKTNYLADRQQIVDFFEEENLDEEINDKAHRDYNSPRANGYSLTIKGFGKNDNLQCTS